MINLVLEIKYQVDFQMQFESCSFSCIFKGFTEFCSTLIWVDFLGVRFAVVVGGITSA